VEYSAVYPGVSQYGRGGAGKQANGVSAQTGSVGEGYGSGGGGAVTRSSFGGSSSANGGTGSAGFVLVEW
jgi:hypothetical protein